MRIIFVFFTLFSLNTFALEVDEKLTTRIVRTSETRKTLMINRGTEDGLVEGDHAKFIVTAGIVARGVCIKVSPSRSVWSVYRLVNADFIVNDSVMTLKITPPVKITKDETKAIVEEDIPSSTGGGAPQELGIPLAEGADDLAKLENLPDNSQDLKSMISEGPVSISEKDVEIFGVLNISALSSNTKTDSGSDSFNNSQSYHHIGLGGELYPRKEREWYSSFSLIGSVNLMKSDNQSYNGSGSTNDITEFSIGTNWHISKLPSVTMDFIPFIHLSFNVGSVNSTYTSGTEGNGTTTDLSATGGTQGFSVGYGYKFFTAKGYSMRALLDYYMRTERYKQDDQSDQFNKVVGGPRLMLGLGYRF